MALNNPYALSFDGVDDYGYVPALKILGTNQVTGFMGWIKGRHIITSSGSATSEYRAFMVNFSPSPPFFVDFAQNVSPTGWSPVRVYSTITVNSSDAVNFVAFIYDPFRKFIELYLNDKYEKINISTINYIDTIPGTVLGRYNLVNKTTFFRNTYDNCSLWNRSLSLTEINILKNKRLKGDEENLLAYHRFDEGSGNTFFDASPNEKNGTIYGASWVPGLVDLEEYEPGQGQKVTGSITFRGRSLMSLAGVKRATGSITFRGGSFMSLIGLVLRELEGVYQISSSEIISRNQPVLSTDLANYIEVWINPRVPADQAEEVYRSKEPEPIPPGESKTFNLKLDKEPVIEAVASLEDAGANLAITDTKYYSGSAEITVKNSGASEQTCTIVVQARPLELQGRRKIVVRDEESILDHGLVKYTFDSPLVQDEVSARDIGEKILHLFAVARANIEIEWRGDPALELADIVQIPEFEKLGVSKKENFYITRQLLEVVEGGLDATLSGRKIPKEGN